MAALVATTSAAGPGRDFLDSVDGIGATTRLTAAIIEDVCIVDGVAGGSEDTHSGCDFTYHIEESNNAGPANP